MDANEANLMALLCTRAGMIMEDVSPDAVTLAGRSLTERRDVIARLQVAIRQMKALVDAAESPSN